MEEYTGVKFRVVFKGSKFGEEKARKEIVKAAKKVSKLGIRDNRTGNISVRVQGGKRSAVHGLRSADSGPKTEDRFVITPTGLDKSCLDPSDMVLVTGFNERANLVEAVGTRQPSSESLMHLLIYHRFPKAGAIIHAHVQSLLKHADKFEATEEAHPYGTKGLAKEAVKALKKSRLIILKDHGILAVGKDLDDCLTTIEKAIASVK